MLWKNQAEIEESFKQYFQDLFRSSSPSNEPQVTPKMKEDLQKTFTREEVEVALKQMVPFKSPGPDGYNAYFSNFIGIL